MTTTTSDAEKKWAKAVTDSRNLIQWLEARNDEKTARIRALEQRVKDLEAQR